MKQSYPRALERIANLEMALDDLLGDTDIHRCAESFPTCRWCAKEYPDSYESVLCESDDCPGFIARSLLT